MKSERWFRNLVALVVLFTLFWFLLDSLEREFQRAEEQAANMVVGNLRSALVIKGAEIMLDRNASLERQEGTNPFELLDHQWGNYSGQCDGKIPEPGDWCFGVMVKGERIQKETVTQGGGWLIYNPTQPITVDRRQASEDKPLAWRVTTEFADRNKNGQREQNERLTGLRLVPVQLTHESATTQLKAR